MATSGMTVPSLMSLFLDSYDDDAIYSSALFDFVILIMTTSTVILVIVITS